MHGAAPPEQGNGVGFIGEAQRIGGEIVTIQFDELERIGGIIDERAQQFFRALADETGIAAVYEEEFCVRRRPRDKTIGLAAADRRSSRISLGWREPPRCGCGWRRR